MNKRESLSYQARFSDLENNLRGANAVNQELRSQVAWQKAERERVMGVLNAQIKKHEANLAEQVELTRRSERELSEARESMRVYEMRLKSLDKIMQAARVLTFGAAYVNTDNDIN